MREMKEIHTGVETWKMVEFDSLVDFYKYIMETPVNKAFKNKSLSSIERGIWSGTNSFDEAVDLFKNGWTVGAQDLTKKLKVAETNQEVQTKYRDILSMAGYQAIVPLYLQGVPNCMVNKKPIPVKNKVITINKAICSSGSVSSETLMNESIKCFQIIKKIEASGIRINLNLMISTGHVCIKIRLKSASEKLNISKLAFPLVHTAMFRRLYFRFVEVYPTIPKTYVAGYGRVPYEHEFKKACNKGEILLPTILYGNTEAEIERLSIDELIERFKAN